MLDNVITLTDGVAPANRTFTLIAKDGMNTKRIETTSGVESSAMSSMVVKQTIDEKSKDKPNRTLVQFSRTGYDVAGKALPSAAHAVLTRHKGETDARVIQQARLLGEVLIDPVKVAALLKGGN